MQQQELAQIRHREANLTALAAIGPRRKRRLDSPVRGAGAEVGGVRKRLQSCGGNYLPGLSQQGHGRLDFLPLWVQQPEELMWFRSAVFSDSRAQGCVPPSLEAPADQDPDSSCASAPPESA